MSRGAVQAKVRASPSPGLVVRQRRPRAPDPVPVSAVPESRDLYESRPVKALGLAKLSIFFSWGRPRIFVQDRKCTREKQKVNSIRNGFFRVKSWKF